MKTGLTRDTIRFYEKKGLIAIPKKLRRDNNYKEYSEYVQNRLLVIIRLKELGFTLSEIKSFFLLWQEKDAACENIVFMLENKKKQVEAELERLMLLKNKLSASLTRCSNDNCEFEKEIPSSM